MAVFFFILSANCHVNKQEGTLSKFFYAWRRGEN